MNIFSQLKAFMLYNSKFKKILVTCESLFIGVSNLLHKKTGKQIFCKVLVFSSLAKHFSQNSDSLWYFSQLLNNVNLKIVLLHPLNLLWSPLHECCEAVIINHSYILFNPFSPPCWNFPIINLSKFQHCFSQRKICQESENSFVLFYNIII